MPSGRKKLILTLSKVQNDWIKKSGRLPAKEAEEIPRNKLCADIIVIQKRYRKKLTSKRGYDDRSCNMMVLNSAI